MGCLLTIWSHKVFVLFIATTAGLGIATVILGLRNAELESQLKQKNANGTDELSNTTASVPASVSTKTTASTSANTRTKTATTAPLLTEKPEKVFTTTQTINKAVVENSEEMFKYRLPKSVVPVGYDVYLLPDLDTGLFRGKVSVETRVEQTTTQIVMHSKELNIKQVAINGKAGTFKIDERRANFLRLRNQMGLDF
jgi:cytoskeletal protein RodZ